MTRRFSSTKGFTRAISLMETRIRTAGEARGFAVTRLLTHWPEVVGPDLAQLCRPVKVGYARGGLGASLTVLCRGCNAPILEMQKQAIRTRVNACYGYNAISRVMITQTAPTGFAEPQANFRAAPKPATYTQDPELRRRAAIETQGLHNSELKRQMEALATNILARNRIKGENP